MFHLPILIAEDDAVSRELFRAAIEGVGLVPLLAENGHEAWVAFQRGNIAALICDWQMPVMDGAALVRAIRATERSDTKRVPIIAVTGSTGRSDREACYQAGVDAVLHKPVRPSQLIDQLMDHVDVSTAINLSQLHSRYRSMDTVANMTAAMQRSLPNDLDALDTLLHDGNGDGLQLWLHRQRGALGALGLVEMEALAASCMDLIRERGFHASEGSLRQLRMQMNRLSSSLGVFL